MLSIGTANESLYKKVPVKTGTKKIKIKFNSVNNNNVGLIKNFQSNAKPFNIIKFSPAFNLGWNSSQYQTPVPLVIAGPSGSGKTTLLKRLMTEFQDCFGFSISRKLYFFV